MTTTTTGTATELDGRCIATIRTLCIDAIQAANSGHPGTPIGIAPVTYTLWQRFLRFDPADPIWPNRDRFVLSSGHASALLWSMLHLTQVQAVDPDYEVLGQRGGVARGPEALPPARLEVPGPSRVPLDERRRDDDGAARAGAATSVGMAVASQWLAARYNRDGFTMFDFDVYAQAGDGCMMEGDRVRGRLVRRPPAALEPVLDLRLEPGHDRGPHRHHLHRGRGRAVHRLRLERRRRVADANDLEQVERALPRLQGRARAPDADRRPQPHRVRLAGRGHAEGARRAARPRGRQGDEAVPGLARGRELPRARRRLRALRGRHRRARPRGSRGVGGDVRGLSGGAPRARRRARADPTPRAAGRAGTATIPTFPPDPKGHREPGLVGPGAERRRASACRG